MDKVSNLHILAFVWRYARQHMKSIILMLIFLIGNTSLALAQPFFYKQAVDAIAEGSIGDATIMKHAMFMVLLGVIMGMISLTFHQAASLLIGKVEIAMMKDIHRDVFAHVQRLSTKFHINNFSGATSRKIGRGVDSVETIMDRIWFNFLPLAIFTIGFTAILTYLAPIIGAALLASIAIYMTYSIFVNLKLAKLYSWTDRQDTRINASLVDTITGNALVKSSGAELREDTRHAEVVSEWGRRQYKSWLASNTITWSQFMLLMGMELGVLVMTVYLWYKGTFTPGSFIVVLFYIGQLWGRLEDIGRNVRDYMRSSAHAEEMISMATHPLEVDDKPNATELQVQKGAVTFDAIDFSYGMTEKGIFQNFSLEIKPGEQLAIVGHSGGGKSTIIKLLMRLYDIQSGAITVDGQNIADVTQESLRNNIGLVPQDPILFHRTIAENIAYGKTDATLEEIREVAKKAHAHEFIESLPYKYDTLVGERGVKLSGGERQRVAIARSMLADKPILLLDEATSSLDSVSEKYIQDALSILMKGRTSIIIAHRLGTVRSVDRIAVIDKGRLIACAPHDELLASCPLYAEMVKLQSHGMLGE